MSSKSNDMNVAILMPTFNRLEFVKRTVSYYDSLKSKHSIYIGDASGAEISRSTLSFLKVINNVSVKYFHWQGLGIPQTIAKLAEEASAECDYCAVQGDDDYFIQSSLAECAEFLSRNPNYRTAQGRAVLVTMDKPDPVCGINGVSQYWGENSIESSSRYDRFCYFKNNYYVLQFSVHRINEFIHDSRDYIAIKNNGVSEIQHCFTFAISGKSKFLDCLYLVRVRHPELLIHTESLIEAITSPNWSADYATTINSLSNTLSEDGEITISEAKKVIVELMNDYLSRKTLGEFRNIGSLRQNLYDRLKNSIPDSMRKVIKSTEHLLLDRVGLRPFAYLLLRKRKYRNDMEFLRTKNSRFYSDFLPVELSLTGKINNA